MTTPSVSTHSRREIAVGSPSHLRALTMLVLHRLRVRRSGAAVGGDQPRAELRVRGLRIPARRLQRYLRVTDGDRVAALGSGRYLPPSLPSIWETAYVLDLLRLSGLPLPLAGLIHLGGERIHLRLPPASEKLDLYLKLSRLEAARGGVRLVVSTRLRNAAGQLCGESEMLLLMRGLELGGDGRSRAPAAEGAARLPESDWREIRSWNFGPGLGRRYALVSGDMNPIHLSGATARLFGFRAPILHGYCVEAMVAHALIEHRLAGDPTALRRLRIHFTSPILLPTVANLEVTERTGGGGGWFRLVGPGEQRPFASGEWTGAVEES